MRLLPLSLLLYIIIMIITRRMPPPACERLGQCFDLPFKHLCWTPQRSLLGFTSFSGGMLGKIWDNHGTSSPETMVFPCLLPMETMEIFCQFSLNQAIVWVSPSSMLLHNQHHHQHHHHHRQGHPKKWQDVDMSGIIPMDLVIFRPCQRPM